METILMRGDSKENTRLLLKLAKQLNFSAKTLSAEEVEEMGIAISIDKGLKTGLLNEKEKMDFLKQLKPVWKMQIEITRKFQKQVDDCKNLRIRSKVLDIIEEIIVAENIHGFKNLKKLAGCRNSYRIRLGIYRLGIVIENKKVIFAAFDHRSDIYKYFPWSSSKLPCNT